MKAHYHQDGLPPKEFDVLKTNADGTLDLGEAETAVVTKCRVEKSAKHGHCTLVEGGKAEKSTEKVPAAEKERGAFKGGKKAAAAAEPPTPTDPPETPKA